MSSAASGTQTKASAVGFRSERGPVLIALMLAIALVALDSTIIATAVPSVVRSLGGFSQFPWLFSVYLLAQAVTVPVYGKFADLFGRKPLMLLGIALFLVGSIACGVAWSMPVLIVFRLLQGLGAGAIQPISMTIVGDIYTLAERAKVQGYLASVWGVCAVVGPTLGGVFSEYVSWRWIFFLNIPLCLLTIAVLSTRFHERVHHSRDGRASIDYAGAGLLTGGCALLILGLLEGGVGWSWGSPTGIAVLAAGLCCVLGFVAVERRVPVPVLPLWVFSRRLLLTTSLAAAGVGALTLALSSYLPTFTQDVLGTGPLVAGLALAALTIGWPIAGSQSGRLYLRIGFRRCALTGCVPIIGGTCLLLLLGGSSSVWQVAGTCFVIGLGLGLVATPTLIAAQATVDWGQRGVVTGNNMFCRSMGSAVGVAIFGAIANAVLDSSAQQHSRSDVALASHHVFIGLAVLGVLMTAAVLAMPADRPAP